jgi:single-stranded DNA-binding protein
MAESLAHSIHRGDRVIVKGRLDHSHWENNQGEKYSKLEITANEIAPSPRWATAEITKNQRPTPQTVPADQDPSGDQRTLLTARAAQRRADKPARPRASNSLLRSLGPLVLS